MTRNKRRVPTSVPFQDLHSIYVIAKQEFVYNLLSTRMLVLVFLFALAVLGSAYGFSYLLIHNMTVQGQEINGVNDVVFGMSAFISYIGSLMAIVFGFDSITREQTQGSLDFLLTRPVSKSGIILGKFIGITLAIITPVSIVLAIGVAIITAMAGWPDITVILALFILTYLFVGTFVSFQQIFSTLAKNMIEALITGIMLFLVYTMFWSLFPLGCGYILGMNINPDPGTTAASQKDTLVDTYNLFNPNGAFQSALSGVIDPSYVSGMHYLVPSLALILWFILALVVNIVVFNWKIQENI
jgi:ABC-type transport system involved in multi-copper enzyme maturation permease subunit